MSRLTIDGTERDDYTITPELGPNTALFQARLETSPATAAGSGAATIRVDGVSIRNDNHELTIEYLSGDAEQSWKITTSGSGEHTDPLPVTSVGCAVYVSYKSFSDSPESWLACLSKDYSSALDIGT